MVMMAAEHEVAAAPEQRHDTVAGRDPLCVRAGRDHLAGAFQAGHVLGCVRRRRIVAGALVVISPQKAGYLVCAWLVLIALSLLSSGSYLDVAVRDLVMAIGAFCLAKISALEIAKN